MTKRRFVKILIGINLLIFTIIGIVIVSVFAYVNSQQVIKSSVTSAISNTNVGPIVLGLTKGDNNKFLVTMQVANKIRLLEYDQTGNYAELFNFTSSSLLPVNSQIINLGGNNFYYIDTNFTNYVINNYQTIGTRSIIYQTPKRIAAINYHNSIIYALIIENDNQLTPTYQLVQIDSAGRSTYLAHFESSFSYYIAEINDTTISLKDLEVNNCEKYNLVNSTLTPINCNTKLNPDLSSQYEAVSLSTTGAPLSYPLSYNRNTPGNPLSYPTNYQTYIYSTPAYNNYNQQYLALINQNPLAAKSLSPPVAIYQGDVNFDLTPIYANSQLLLILAADHYTNERKLISLKLNTGASPTSISLPLVNNIVAWGGEENLGEVYFDLINGNPTFTHNLYIYSWINQQFFQGVLPLCPATVINCNYGLLKSTT